MDDAQWEPEMRTKLLFEGLKDGLGCDGIIMLKMEFMYTAEV
jgi:hypothetical protein